MKTEKELKEIRRKLKSLPYTKITCLNENEGYIVRDVAYQTIERLSEIQRLIGATRVYVTYTPAKETRGIVIGFDF